MRVLFITGSYPPMKCGVGDYSRNLAESLARLPNFQVGVLTSRKADGSATGSSVTMFSVIDSWKLLELPKVISVVLKWAPDVVHVQYPTQGYGRSRMPWLLPILCFLMGKKIVQTWHEEYGGRYLPWMLAKMVTPSKIVVVRPGYQERVHPWLRWLFKYKDLSFIRSAAAIPTAHLVEPKFSEIRAKYLQNQKRLIVFFGFIYPHKRLEFLFEIATPQTDQIVIAGEAMTTGAYLERIRALAASPDWCGKVNFTGFLPEDEIAELLAVADTVVLPFQHGGGEWNTSILGAILQKTFVLTTSKTVHGYDEMQNVYFSRIDDVEDMRQALQNYSGQKRKFDSKFEGDDWQRIAASHIQIYSEET